MNFRRAGLSGSKLRRSTYPFMRENRRIKILLPLVRKLRSDPTVCDGIARDPAHAQLSLFVYLRSSVKRIISDDLLLLYIYDSVLS